MKQNISINISGIPFHMEEDAYENFKDYLGKISRYFSTYEDSDEIIADIENRITEIFLTKLTEEKQVINTEDVSSLIATLGTTKDFQAMEEPDIDDEKTDGQKHQYKTEPSKKLFRDVNRKVIGGVASGVAHYFNIDPLWVRLLLLLLVLGSYGSLLIVYVIMWIVVPEKRNLPEDKTLKKLFRDPDDRILSGVSSGLAIYFGIDVLIVRLLFVGFMIFGGSGLIVYIILWIITPKAMSITDKMKMQGDPITLSNIEATIKDSFHAKPGEEEQWYIKLILFPFRLLGAFFDWLAKVFGSKK